MTTSFDDLVEQLLYDVALSGSKGIGAEELERAVRAFHESQKQYQQQKTPVNDEDLPSLDATAASSTVDDDSPVDPVWASLEKHPDVEIKEIVDVDACLTYTNGSEALQKPPINSTGPSPSKHAGKRIFTSTNRIWQVTAGHGVDTKRVPLMEFHLLSIIAAHGPEGILQPDLTKLAQQDKRSVPKRTDDLAAKGYISKDKVIITGQQTAMLKLRKFANPGVTGPLHVRAFPEKKKRESERPIVYYDVWFNEFLRMVIENAGIIALQDLRIGLKIHRQEWGRRALKRCIDRLVETGLVRKLKAKVEDENGPSSEESWVNCVQLLRDSTDADRVAFTGAHDSERTTRLKREYGRAQNKEAEESNDDGVLEEDVASANEGDKDHDSEARLHNKYYSFRNLEKSGEGGETEWEPVTENQEVTTAGRGALLIMVVPSSELEEWGFTKLDPKVFADKDGRASLLGCPAAARNPFRLINENDNPAQSQDGSARQSPTPGQQRKRKRKKRSLLTGTSIPHRTANPNNKKPPTTDIYRKVYQTKARRTTELPAIAEMNAASKKRTAEDARLDQSGPTKKEPRIHKNTSHSGFTNGSQNMATEDSRSREIEANTLDRSKPGVYINPPGAKEARFAKRNRRGSRPRSIVAVFKSDKLRDLPWFQEDVAEAQPNPTSRRKQHLSSALDAAGTSNGNASMTMNQQPVSQGPAGAPKKKMGRPTKAMVAARERQRLAALEVQQRPNTPDPPEFEANESSPFDSGPAFATRQTKLASAPLASRTMPASASAPQAPSVTDSMQPESTDPLAADAAVTNVADTTTLPKKRKRGRAPNAELAERKRPKQRGSLIVKLPLGRELLSDNGDGAVENEVRDSGTGEANRIVSVANPDSTSAPSLMVTLPLPSTWPGQQRTNEPDVAADAEVGNSSSKGVVKFSLPQRLQTPVVDQNSDTLTNEPTLVQDGSTTDAAASVSNVPAMFCLRIIRPYLKSSTSSGLSMPSTENRTPRSQTVDNENTISRLLESDDAALAPDGGSTRTNAGKRKSTDVNTFSKDHGGTRKPPKLSSREIPHDSERFPAVEGITVRRTADGIAMLNAELLFEGDSSEEPDSSYRTRKRRTAPKPKRRLDSSSTHGVFLGSIGRLLMCPGQVFHGISGTIGTVSTIGSASARLEVFENVWKRYHNAPNDLQDILNRAAQLGHAGASAIDLPADRFNREVERVKAWEESLVNDNCLIDLGEGRTFINHRPNSPFPPAVPYFLEVEAKDFFLQRPPFEDPVKPKLVPPKSKSKATTPHAADENKLATQQSSHGHGTSYSTNISAPSNHSTSSLRRPSDSNQADPFINSSLTRLQEPNIHAPANGFTPRLYPGPDLPKAPLLSLTSYWTPTTPIPTPVLTSPNAAPPTPEISTTASSSRQQTPGETEEPEGVQSTPEAVTPTKPKQKIKRKPARKSTLPANEGEEGCSTCARYNRTCYGGSATEKCNFCKATKSWCSRVSEDGEKITKRAEGVRFRGGTRGKSDVQMLKTSGVPQEANVVQRSIPNGVSGPTHSIQPQNTGQQGNKCGRCEQFNKDCIAGSTVEKCGYCKATKSLCSKVDEDREKLIKWGRYLGKAPTYAASRQHTSESHKTDGLNSATHLSLMHSGVNGQLQGGQLQNGQLQNGHLQNGTSQSGLQNAGQQAGTETGGKRKRQYTYKPRKKAKTATVSNMDGPPDQISIEDSVRDAPASEKTSDSIPARFDQTPSTHETKKSRAPPFAEPQRLSIAVALANMLYHGIDREPVPNWDIVAHALSFKYDKTTLRNRWTYHQRTRGEYIRRLQLALHEPFLRAYENGEIPTMDFDNLNETDWPALVRWVETDVLPLDEIVEEPVEEPIAMQDLPASRETFETSFESILQPQVGENKSSGTRANVNGTSQPHPTNKPPPLGAKETRESDDGDLPSDMILAKSRIRAVAMTKEEAYDVGKATHKLWTLNSETLREATAQLERLRTIVRRKVDRQLPGRNYMISKGAFSHFKRWTGDEDEFKSLRSVATAWTKLVRHFKENDHLTLSPHASEPDALVLNDMVAQGHLKITGTLPDFESELLQSIRKSNGAFYFPVVYLKTPRFTADHGLERNVPIPTEPPAPLSGAIPLWIDIHGNLLDEVWDMVLHSVLHSLVFKSGSTAKDIEKGHNGQLWAWEIEMMLGWMEKVGMAQKIGTGNEHGWTVSPSWYCAFSSEVATWKTPTDAMCGVD